MVIYSILKTKSSFFNLFDLIKLVNLLCNQNGLNCYKTLKSNQNYQLNRIPTDDYWTGLNLTKGYNYIDNTTLFNLGFRDQLNKGDLLFIKANEKIKKYQIYSNTEINDFMCTFYRQKINNTINEYYNCSYSPTDFTIAARLILDYDVFSTYSNRTVTFQHNYTNCGTFNLTSNAVFFSNSYDPFSINKTRKIDVLCPNENKAIIDILESLNNDPVGCLLNCSNNGVCELKNQKFQCLCKQYFVGSSCDIDTRICLTSNTCLNNSTCIDYSLNASLNSNEFYCKCENNLFYGTHCEHKLDICLEVTCSNNGNCIDLNGKPFCECYNNFYGENCENQTASLKIIKSVSMIASCIAAISMVLLYLLIIFLDLSKVAKKKFRKRKTFIRFRYVNI